MKKVYNAFNSKNKYPSSDDRLFKSDSDWSNNACLNWSHDKRILYIHGYKEAAGLLARHIENKGESQDILIFPIIFLYRHYLELELKNIIIDSHELIDSGADVKLDHKISVLWQTCSQLLNKIDSTYPKEELKQVGRLIREFEQIDPLATAFRYPEDKVGKPSLPTEKLINIRNVREVFEKIEFVLSCISCFVGERLAYKKDEQKQYELSSESPNNGQ